MIKTFVALGIGLIVASVLLRRGRAGRFALIGGVVSLFVALVLSPDLLLATADWISELLDGKPPDY